MRRKTPYQNFCFVFNDWVLGVGGGRESGGGAGAAGDYTQSTVVENETKILVCGFQTKIEGKVF